jgi:hypothetical protein
MTIPVRKWKTSTPPRGQPILVSDGKLITITQLDDWESRDERGTLTFMHGVNFGGYEWEYDLRFEDITHWMPLPGVPK